MERSCWICHACRVLQLAGIAKAFGSRHALAHVSLDVRVGEAVLLVGPNGAGKTTLLRIATGFLDPDGGGVTIDGIAMASARSHAQARLGYLPEHAAAPPELTVRDYLLLRARIKQAARQRGGRARTATLIDDALATVGIGDESKRTMATLSKGFRQRVGLADALLGSPPLLILDEPTTGMDPMQLRDLRDQLTVAAQQRALLVSSHAVADLAPLATRVAVMRRGTLVADAAPAALLAQTRAATLEDAVIALCREGAAA